MGAPPPGRRPGGRSQSSGPGAAGGICGCPEQLRTLVVRIPAGKAGINDIKGLFQSNLFCDLLPCSLVGRPLATLSPCLLHQGGWAMLQPSSHLLCLQHVASFCTHSGSTAGSSAGPGCQRGLRGHLSVRKGQWHSRGPCKQKAPQLHWDVPAARGPDAGQGPLGAPVQAQRGQHPQELRHHRVGKGVSGQ